MDIESRKRAGMRLGLDLDVQAHTGPKEPLTWLTLITTLVSLQNYPEQEVFDET
jgi:hypothetical protein